MPAQTTVKVFSYNVQMLDQMPSLENRNEERARLIAGLLAQTDYDVLVFQEAFDNSARKEMLKILKGKFPYMTAVVGHGDGLNFYHAIGLFEVGLAALPFPVFGAALAGAVIAGFIFGPPRSDGGVFIMSRWPILYQGQIVYKQSASEDRFGKKGVSWALIDKLGFYFNVFGTHTQADKEFANTRVWQFHELKTMVDNVTQLWHPTLLAGDMNVDYCFDKDRCRHAGNDKEGCCDPSERDSMLRLLGARPPQDLSKFVYTSDPANDIKPDGGTATTLDYVLTSNAHPSPVRSSLETVKLRAPWRPKHSPIIANDLSDHYAVLGTYTFQPVREDSNRFTGTWRCVSFNNQPDTHRHGITCQPFGYSIAYEFDGKISAMRIHQLQPTGENKGKIVLREMSGNKLVEYEYTFNANEEFKKYFSPGNIRPHEKPRAQNELLLRNRTRSMLYAFESWLPVDFERPGGGPV